MCAPSAPPPPDYAGAAQAQGAANVDAARTTVRGANPNIISPTGTRTVTWGTNPDGTPTDQATVRQDLTPDQQRIFDLNQQGQEGLATVGRDAVSRVGGILGQDVNFNQSLGTQEQGRQSTIDAMMSRYDTDMGRRKEAVESDLIARGIPRGSEAYNREMELLNRGRNDALQQSTIAADDKSMNARRQQITELLAQRQTPMNEISALRSGSQVAPLSFQPYTGATTAAAPTFNAAQAQGQADQGIYNAQVGQSNATTSAAAGLGAAAIMMF